MNPVIGSTEEWIAEVYTGSRLPHEWLSSLHYRNLRAKARGWLKVNHEVYFKLTRRATNRALKYPVELIEDAARVNIGGDLVTFGEAVTIMKRKLEENMSG